MSQNPSSTLARAATVLVASEVACLSQDLNKCWGGQLSVDLSFTLGSLTNVIVKHYASPDGVVWHPVAAASGVISETITATALRAYILPGLGGFRYYRASLTGTGTVTSSSATVVYRFLRVGSQ